MDLNFILQNVAGNLYWKDAKGQYQGANKAFIQLAGLKNFDDIKGRTDRDLFQSFMSDKKLAKIEKTDQEVITSGISQTIKEEGIDNAGKPALYITKKIPLFNESGKVVGLMGTSLDISKELQAEQAKKEFLANMRHDIRTPLSGIVGFSEIIKQEAKFPQVKEYADNLVASSYALLDLIDEVLEAVKVSSGEIPLIKTRFDLKETLQSVIDLQLPVAARFHNYTDPLSSAKLGPH